MNDVFVEQIVLHKKSPLEHLKYIGITAGMLALNLAVLFFGVTRIIFPVTFALSCWYLYNILRDSRVEYEYSFTNGELDVDRIRGKRKREHLAGINVRRLDLLAPMTGEYARETGSQSIRALLDASEGEKSPGRWFARYADENGIETLLIFNPNDRLLYAMGRLLGRKFRGDLGALEKAE